MKTVNELKTEAIEYAIKRGCYPSLTDALQQAKTWADLRSICKQAVGPGSWSLKNWLLACLKEYETQSIVKVIFIRDLIEDWEEINQYFEDGYSFTKACVCQLQLELEDAGFSIAEEYFKQSIEINGNQYSLMASIPMPTSLEKAQQQVIDSLKRVYKEGPTGQFNVLTG